LAAIAHTFDSLLDANLRRGKQAENTKSMVTLRNEMRILRRPVVHE
jgi:hypothetical protein